MSDGAFLGYENGKVKFKAAGVTGLVNPSEVGIIDYDNAKTVSCYKTSNGGLYHYVANIITNSDSYYSVNYIGNIPSYLSNNTTYYSYDGHYFYASYNRMIDDYKNGVYSNSVNSNNPYYNYFQYLPARSKTSLTASQLDQYTIQMVSSGKLLNAGSSLISNQNTYGVNALIMYANAALESGWGQSQIAINRNNLFGHGAVDSNPYYGANGYASVDDCVKYHAKMFISEGYCDPEVFGKKIGGDILCIKKTYMLIKALNRADEKQHAELNRWLNAEAFQPSEKIEAVTEIYNQLNIRNICESKMREYYTFAMESLAAVAVAEDRKKELKNLVKLLMYREM